MSFKLKLFDGNIFKNLKHGISIKRKPLNNYSQYILSEYSRVRLTHDIFDNHYFYDPTVITASDSIGLSEENNKSRRR